ncbi:MAG: hypothetical protein K0B52_03365 [FCB group bacterium]|nr:hypothetical protein [FCB group bacterium]
MNTFENVKGKLSQWWESISPKIDDAYQATKEKAGDFGRIGKLKYEIFQTRRVLLKCYQELGEKVVRRIEEQQSYDMLELEQMDDMLSQIRELKNKISALENEIIHLQAEEKIK